MSLVDKFRVMGAKVRRNRQEYQGKRLIHAIGCLAAALFLCGLIAVSAQACLPIGRGGSPVEVAEETAVILWDAEAKTEHFIRRARFLSDAKDIGFLVPTPTRPELVEVDNGLFDELWRYTNPPPPAPPSRDAIKFAGPTPLPKPDMVQVLEKKKVAGLDATILAATDAKALTEWLKKNDYPTTPETQTWLEPYLKDQWIITAYKIDNSSAASAQAPRFQTSAVRMSFKAEKPFYPYREPRGAGKNARERLLRVYFLSQQAHDAQLLEHRWETTIPYANRITPVFQERLAGLLKLPRPSTTSDPWFLTEFEDRVTMRKSGGEVVFVPKADLPVQTRPQPSSFGFSSGVGFSTGSGASGNSVDREAMRSLIPAGMAFLGLVAFTGWAILRRRKPASLE